MMDTWRHQIKNLKLSAISKQKKNKLALVRRDHTKDTKVSLLCDHLSFSLCPSEFCTTQLSLLDVCLSC